MESTGPKRGTRVSNPPGSIPAHRPPEEAAWSDVPRADRDVAGDIRPAEPRATSEAPRADAPPVREASAPTELRDDERIRVGLAATDRVPSTPAGVERPHGLVSPLAAVRFAAPRIKVAGDPKSTGGRGLAERSPGGWLQERMFRPASYLLMRATGRLPAVTTSLEALSDPDATVLRKRKLGGGINGSFVLELSNGAKAVWKPSAAEHMKQMRDCIEGDHQARREAAAFLVDGWLGHLARVPPTLYREVEGEAGALMAFVEGKPAASERREANSPPRRSDGPEYEDYRRIAIFDHVIGNLDRHSGNWLVKNDGALVPIDHGIAFPLHNGAPGHHKFAFYRPLKLRESELAALRNLLDHREQVAAQLEPLLAQESVHAMFERVDVMVAKGTTDHGWRAYGHAIEQTLLAGVPPAE